MEFARFDLTGLSVANVQILQPGVTVSYTYETYSGAQSCLVSFTIPNRLINSENNGLRLTFPPLSGKVDFFFNNSNVNSGRVSIESGVLVCNCRVRAHDNFIVQMAQGSRFAIDFGIESLDVSSAQQNNLTLLDSYLFNGGYRGDPRPPVTSGDTIISFVSVYEEGSYQNAVSDGVTLSAFKLPKPAKFWIEKRLSEEYAVYKDDVLP
jgi:hypothetical protein